MNHRFMIFQHKFCRRRNVRKRTPTHFVRRCPFCHYG